MSSSATGYSGTPLAKKLGIKEGSQIVVMNAPGEYLQWLSPIPARVVFQTDVSTDTELVHLFVMRKKELDQILVVLRESIPRNAAVWVLWPKKSSKVPTDITEDIIRDVALPIGFVDVKVCAVSEVWSGLKLYIRKELR